MGKGHEYLTKIHEALREFEDAVVNREKFKPLESRVTRQQVVDHARKNVVEAVVDIVTEQRMKQ